LWTRKLSDQSIDRHLYIRPRNGCGSDFLELRPAVPTLIFQLFIFCLLCSSVGSNTGTPSRNRDNRRNRARCGQVAAKWFLDGRSQISTQLSTLPSSCSPPTQSSLKRPLHQLVEFLSRSCQLGFYSSGWYSQNLCGFPGGKTVHIAELEGSKQSG
jgi:hypothetical protein